MAFFRPVPTIGKPVGGSGRVRSPYAPYPSVRRSFSGLGDPAEAVAFSLQTVPTWIWLIAGGVVLFMVMKKR